MLAEIACGIRTGVLTAIYHHPMIIFLGTMVGTAIVMTLAVALGNSLNISNFWLKLFGGVFFIFYGIFLILGKV